MADYILREAVIKEHCMNCQYIDQEDDKSACWCMEKDRINAVPSADVRPVVRGGWKPNPKNPYWLDCTVCGYAKPERTVYNFCPNCGADMRGEGTDFSAPLKMTPGGRTNHDEGSAGGQ